MDVLVGMLRKLGGDQVISGTTTTPIHPLPDSPAHCSGCGFSVANRVELGRGNGWLMLPIIQKLVNLRWPLVVNHLQHWSLLTDSMKMNSMNGVNAPLPSIKILPSGLASPRFFIISTKFFSSWSRVSPVASMSMFL